MTIQELIYALYQVHHKHGNLLVAIMNKDLGAVGVESLCTVDLRPSQHEMPIKLLCIQDEFSSKKALVAHNRHKDAVITPEKIAGSNVLDLFTRKKVLS